MKKEKQISRRKILKGASLIALAFVVKPLKLLASPLMTSYRFGIQGKSDTRFVLETPQSLSYRTIYLNNSNRIVIDFKTLVNLSLNTQMSPIGSIKSVRSGRLNHDYFRVVLDLKNPALISKSFILSPKGGAKYRMVFDITNTSQSNFNKKISVFSYSNNFTKQPIISSKIKKTKVIKKKKTPIIVLDPGHGGKDPGAIGKNKTLEKHVVLSVAKKLEKILKTKGYKVYLTRRTDKYLKLRERSLFAQKKHADLFLSIHADSNPNRSAKGLSVYTLSDKATDEESRKLAQRENAADLIGFSGFEKYDKNVQFFLADIGQDLSVQEGIILAELIVENAKKSGVNYLKRTHRSAPFAVLKSTVPSVLAELGFLTNRNEEMLLKQSYYQNKLAKTIANAISKYSFS